MGRSDHEHTATTQRSWVVKIDEDLRTMEAMGCPWKKQCIYKLPTCVTDLNRNAYEPKAVSFGPYHHGAPHLKPMEEHKVRALLQFVKRSKENNILDQLVRGITEIVQDLQDCYNLLDAVWHDDMEGFVRMMILDGCFMLEILRPEAEVVNDYEEDDPIFSNHGRQNIMPYFRRDMLMLENQLPMLVMEKLVAIEGQAKDKDHLIKLLLKFFSQDEKQFPYEKSQHLHVLDVYRKSLIHQGPSKKTRPPRGGDNKDDAIIRSAAELDEAGIGFKKSPSISLRDISFTGGVLRLPVIVVDDITESMFLNLIAFERFHVNAGKEVTSYIFIMDSIIDSEHDVTLLHSKGIIQNAIGSDKAAAKLFNSLSRDVTPDEKSNLMAVHKRVNVYCKKPWNAWRANLCHTYLRSPWAIISLLAAVLLFALTIIQTVFTVHPKK